MIELVNIKLDIKRIIVEKLEVNIDPEEIDDDEMIFGGGLGLDSVVSLMLIAELEQRYNIEFSDDDLDLSFFESITSMANYVKSKLK